MAGKLQVGQEFLAGVLEKLPEGIRAQAQAAFSAPEAQSAIEVIADGVLRQQDYSRRQDALSTQATQLNAWADQLDAWKTATEASLAARAASIGATAPAAGGGTPRTPTTPTPAAPATGLAADDVRQLVGEEFGRREVYIARFVSESTKLATDHLRQFGEVLDVQALIGDPQIAELGLEGVYRKQHAEKIQAAAAQRESKAREALKQELRAEVVREMGAGATVPYPVGDGSPLDALGQTPEQQKAYTVDAAVAYFNQLQSAR